MLSRVEIHLTSRATRNRDKCPFSKEIARIRLNSGIIVILQNISDLFPNQYSVAPSCFWLRLKSLSNGSVQSFNELRAMFLMWFIGSLCHHISTICLLQEKKNDRLRPKMWHSVAPTIPRKQEIADLLQSREEKQKQKSWGVQTKHTQLVVLNVLDLSMRFFFAFLYK